MRVIKSFLFSLSIFYTSSFSFGQSSDILFGSVEELDGSALVFSDRFGVQFSNENPAIVAIGFFGTVDPLSIQPSMVSYSELVSDFVHITSFNFLDRTDENSFGFPGVKSVGVSLDSDQLPNDLASRTPYTFVIGGINDWANRLANSVSSFSVYTDSSYRFEEPSLSAPSTTILNSRKSPDRVIVGSLVPDQEDFDVFLRTEEVRPIPETSSIHLIALGLVGMALRRRRA